MFGFYLRRVLLALLLAGLVYVVVTSDCSRESGQHDARPAVTITIGWSQLGDVPLVGFSGLPGGSSPGHRVSHSNAQVVRIIDGEQYTGPLLRWDVEYEDGHKEMRLIEVVAHRSRESEDHALVHVLSSYAFTLQFEGVSVEAIRDFKTGELVAPPYRFEPGMYHFEAVITEQADGE